MTANQNTASLDSDGARGMEFAARAAPRWTLRAASVAFLFATLPVRSTSSPTSFSFAALPVSPLFNL